MALVKETEYGKIILSNELFKEAIENACMLPETSGKLWIANKPGINAKYNDSGKVSLEFSIVAKFGIPISDTCKHLADALAEQIRNRSGEYPSEIKINVVGVKSKNIVKRAMEVVCEY